MQRTALAIAAAWALQGCAYHSVVVANGVPADQRVHPVESSAIAWGAAEKTTIASECPSDLLFEVRTQTSFLQSLATVLTLGFWQPVRMEYRCAKPPTQTGVIEP